MARKLTSVGKIMNLLTVLEPGDSFYAEGTHQQVTAYASHLKVKCSTSKILVIEDCTGEPKVKFLIKVTIL